MQHEFENPSAIVRQDFLERVDLHVARFDFILGRELAHPADQHVLVMRAVEDADEAAARGGEMHAPQEIARQLFLARLFEGGDDNAERTGLLKTCLMVPSLPALSIPCSTTSRARLPSA